MAKNGAFIKMMHTAFPKGPKFGYAAVIVTTREYQKKFTTLESTWTFLKPTKLATYNPSIKTLAEDFKNIISSRCWNYDEVNMRFILESKMCGRGGSSRPTTYCGSK